MLSCWLAVSETAALNVVNVKIEVIYLQFLVLLCLKAGRLGRWNNCHKHKREVQKSQVKVVEMTLPKSEREPHEKLLDCAGV